MSAGPGSRRLEELFERTLELPPEERESFVEAETRDDPALRKDLLELIARDDEAGGFFDGLHRDIASSAHRELDAAARPKVEIGPFRAIELLGQGGMGVVYLAERVDGAFKQRVALKLLHLDMLHPAIRARFLAERQLLAQLSHPNIARLQDGGVTDENRPYFVMEYVDGVPITSYVERQALSVRETLRLFLSVIDAVRYLHRNLVVHRDLKPSNVFVDRDGNVKLLDFGIAKLLSSDENLATVTHERLLTPQYAAPEQVTGDAITTSTDVFSLGVMLYQLLTGSLPYERGGEISTQSLSETARPPSAKLGGRADGGRRNAVAGDLDRICLKAIRPEPERRYASAEQLGEDVRRYLDGLPVRARRSTFAYRATTFLKRNRIGVMAAALLAALLVFWFVRERALRDEAQQAALKAQAVSTFLGDLISSADPANAQGEEVTVLEVLDQADDALAGDHSLAEQPAVESEVRLVLGRTYGALGRSRAAREQYERALDLAGGPDSQDLHTLRILEAIARSESDMGKSEALLRRTLEARERILGSDHRETLSAKGALVRAVRFQRRFEEAERLAREVFEARRRTLGPADLDTLRAQNAVGSVLYESARFQEAAEAYEAVVASALEHLGPRHPQTLRFSANLGATYTELGRYRDAERLQRQVAEERLRILGDRHVLTGMSMHNLGSLYLQLGRFPEAEDRLRAALVGREEVGGAGYLYSKIFLGEALREQERLDEAESTLRDCVEAYEGSEILRGHEDHWRALAALAKVRFLRGARAEAREIASSVLTSQLEVVGDKRLAAADTLHLLARIDLAEGRPSDAVERTRQALEISSEVFPAGHPILLIARLESARALLADGSSDVARGLLDGLDHELASYLGGDHPKVVEARDLRSELGASTGSSTRS